MLSDIALRGAARKHSLGTDLLCWLTVIDNIAFGLRERGVAEAERRRLAQAWCARVGLSGFERHYPRQLSGGIQQRTAIARGACE
jgi:NitT/TauT family transport system ATP-binding protein/sulfonate transport system ATP-binding protein